MSFRRHRHVGRRRRQSAAVHLKPGEARVLVVARDRPFGGSFQVSSPATISRREPLDNGWAAELVEGSQRLVVRGSRGSAGYVDSLQEASSAAQEALDRLSMRGLTDLTVDDGDSSHIVWWRAGRKVVVRVVSISNLGASFSATATVTSQDGVVQPEPPPPALPWHQCLRYFRLSQVASDLFDAYRNMYLALEALLDDVVPQKLGPSGRPSENEGAWLRRALTNVDTNLPLVNYAPPGSASGIDGVFDDLYSGTRTRLFHSKSGRPVLLPHGVTDRAAVIDSLERMSRLFLDLFQQRFGFTRPSGALTHAGFALMTNFDGKAAVSDDPSPERKADLRLNPAGGGISYQRTRRAPELGGPGLTFWLGRATLANARRNVAVVRRVGLTGDNGQLLQVERLSEPLALEGFDVLETQIGTRLVNRQLPRALFRT